MLDSYDEPLYFDEIRDAARCVADTIRHDLGESTEAVISALDDHLEHHDDDETWYSFLSFEEGED